MRFFESMVVVAVTGGALLAACGNSEDNGGGGDAGIDASAVSCSTSADTTSDVHHCGDCSTDCTTLPHVDASKVTCEKSQCVTYPACAAGFADCSVTAPGCETALGTSATCAKCGDSCSSDAPVCNAGACSASCAKPFPDACGGSCVDTQTDTNNCGECGRVCTSDAGAERGVCVAGVCQSGCQGGFHACGGTCVSDASATACGASCEVCPGAALSEPTCVEDRCALICATGAHSCVGTCVDDHAVATCGASCTACPTFTGSTSTCDGTSCGFACDTGYADCNGVPSDACEVKLAGDDPRNCGACGHDCRQGTCSAGVCQGFAIEARAELVNVAADWGGFYVADAHDLEFHTAFNSWTGPAGDYTDIAAGGIASISITSAGTVGMSYSDQKVGLPIAVPGGYLPTHVALAGVYGAWTDTAGDLYATSNGGAAVEEYASPYGSAGTCAFADVNDYPIYWEMANGWIWRWDGIHQGAVVRIAQLPGVNGAALAADATYAYAGDEAGRVYRAPILGGALSLLTTRPSAIASLVVSGSYLYILTDTALERDDLATGSISTLSSLGAGGARCHAMTITQSVKAGTPADLVWAARGAGTVMALAL